MTSNDLPAFLDTFRGIARVFPLRGSDDELRQLEAAYFKTLRRFPMEDVQSAAERVLSTSTRFPKPAEWIAALPKATMGAGDFRQMTDAEAREYRRAERLRYEDHPCLCHDCVRAGIDEKPLRFVPDFDGDGAEVKAFDPLLKRLVTTGHWAHGDELARWYVAKNAFYAKFRAWIASKSMKPAPGARAVHEASREPGEEG